MKNPIVTTGNEIPGKEIAKVLGVVRGNTVRARNIGRDIGAGLKNLVGGEIKTYTEMTSDSRDEAFNRMVNDAIKLGADAVIATRFMTSMVMQGASEMLAYGTAVKLK
ncbi:MAG TPA: heavy metal-binding domain-containing protein [Candidatus Pacearchaeota archaeon]|nr:heavy metal-binding domain-containing protein [Candidatus Pacearchaeota archaeon]